MQRRVFVLLIAATVLTPVLSSAPAHARELVKFSGHAGEGTIVVRTNERRLYLVMGDGRAYRYPVGVGRSGKQWFGTTSIVSKHIRPAWSPPKEIRRSRESARRRE